MVTVILKLLLLLLDPHCFFPRSSLSGLHMTSELRLPLSRVRSAGVIGLGSFVTWVELMAHDGHIGAESKSRGLRRV